MQLKRFNEMYSNDPVNEGGNSMYLALWNPNDGPGIEATDKGGFHVYSEEFIGGMLDELLEGSEETFNRLKSGEKITNDGEQLLNGYMNWIVQIPLDDA